MQGKGAFRCRSRKSLKPNKPFLSPPSVLGHLLARQPVFLFRFRLVNKNQSKAKRCLAVPGEPASPLPVRTRLWLRNAVPLARRWFQYSHRSCVFIPGERKNSLPFWRFPENLQNLGRYLEKKKKIFLEAKSKQTCDRPIREPAQNGSGWFTCTKTNIKKMFFFRGGSGQTWMFEGSKKAREKL